jgi:WD40 repeat protein
MGADRSEFGRLGARLAKWPDNGLTLEIRQIAVSADGRRAVLGAFKENVEIWDLNTGTAVAAFTTILDFGGQRLTIDKSGSVVVAAAYGRDGVAGYNAENGKLLWRRRDLKKTQYLTSSPRADHIYAGFESGPGCVLDSRTGETLSRHPGVRRFVESAHEPLIFLDGARPTVSSADSLIGLFAVERSSFAFLSAAFAPSQIAVSEAGGDVRCFELRDGCSVWTFKPRSGLHCLALTYSKDDDAFFGILWPYEIGGDKELVRFNGDGSASLIARIGQPAETAFEQTTATLVTSDRRLINISKGAARVLSLGL